MAVRTYDSSKVTLIWGSRIITGFSDDSQVTVERMTDTWTDQVGADGAVTRARTNDNRGTITIVLSQSSPSNDDLQANALNDELNGTGVYPGLLRDASGRTICSGDAIWVVKPANVDLGRSLTVRTWTLRVANLIMGVGGNN